MEEIKIGQKLYFIENDVIVEWEVINKNPNNTRFLILISGEIIRQVHWKDIIYGIQYNTCPETLVKTYEENVLARIDKLKKALKIENKKENPDEELKVDDGMKQIKSVVGVGDVIEAEYLGSKQIFKIEKIEVALNNNNIRPIDWVIVMKVSYDNGTIECTSDNFKYIRHITHTE